MSKKIGLTLLIIMIFSNASSGGARDGSDPIAELLSQLSGVRRAQSNSVPGSSASSSQGPHNVSSQLQQLQMQLQLERQQVRVLYCILHGN